MLTNNARGTGYVDPSPVTVYHQNNGPQVEQSHRFINQYAGYLASPLLDIGCGDGKVTSYLAQALSGSVTGMDISEERAAFATKEYGSDHLDFVVGNALAPDETPAIANKLYQTIVSFNAIHHIPKNHQAKFFSAMYHKLDENGVALFLIPALQDYHRPIREVTGRPEWAEYFKDFNFDDVRTYEHAPYYRDIAQEAGFIRESIICEERQPDIEMDFDSMKNYFAGWLPHLVHLNSQHVSDELKDRFLNDIVTLYFSQQQTARDAKVKNSMWQNKMVLFKSAQGLAKTEIAETKERKFIL